MAKTPLTQLTNKEKIFVRYSTGKGLISLIVMNS